MPQGNLNNLLGAARDFRNFQQEPEQIRMAKQDQKTTQRSKEMAVKLQEAGIDNELRAMKQKGELEVLYKWQALSPDQKPIFLRQEMLKRQTMGQDVSKFSEIINLPPDVQEDLIGATISAAEQMGRGGKSAQYRNSPAPSAVQEYQFVQSLSPQERQEFVNLKRATPSVKAAEFGGERGVLYPDGTFKALSTVEQEAEAGATIDAASTRAVEETKDDVERVTSAPARAEKARQIIGNVDNVIDRAIEAQGLVSNTTAGFGGLLSVIPTSNARELGTLVTTIQANLGFDRLQQMREASPTGGALGQVSERELDFLQSSVQNLDTKVAPDVLRNRLQEIVVRYGIWKDAIIDQRGKDLELDGLSEEDILKTLKKEFPNE
tara:strand:+ start:12373 stop:13506 length:1134 start_codon:yes stop_codon:yes gene_type:complete